MTATTSETTLIPEVLQSEDGDTYWAQGHIDPMAMVLGIVVFEMACNDGEHALEFLIERPCRYTSDKPHWTERDARKAAGNALEMVRHVWMRQDPDDEEIAHPAKEGDAGAEPWTRVSL
jgi:hypothetical protein